MHGARQIELVILKHFKKTTPYILLIILILYVLNVNNHYKLFLSKDNRLRSEIESCKHSYLSIERFTRGLLEHADLIGNEVPSLGKNRRRDKFEIIAIKHANTNRSTNISLARILNIVDNEQRNIRLSVLSDGDIINTKNGHLSSAIGPFLDKSAILLIGNYNQILSAFSIDGTESPEVLRLISDYLLRVIPEAKEG